MMDERRDHEFYRWLESIEKAAESSDGQAIHRLNRQLFYALKEHKEDKEKVKLIKEVIIKINLGLIHFVCKPLYAPDDDVDYEDLFQSGVMGLLRAIEKYDPDRNVTFASYAIHWIKAMVYQTLSQAYQIVHLPRGIVSQLMKARRARADFLRRHAREPTVEEIRALLDEPIHSFDQLPTTNRVVRLDQELYDEDKPELVHAHVALPENDTADRLVKEAIEELLQSTDPITAQIVQRRFGFPPYRTSQEIDRIAKSMHLSEEEVVEKLSRFIETAKRHLPLSFLE